MQIAAKRSGLQERLADGLVLVTLEYGGARWGSEGEKNRDCGNSAAGFVSPGCQGPWRFGRRTPPGLDRSNGSLSGLAADSLAALFASFQKVQIKRILSVRINTSSRSCLMGVMLPS